MSAFKKVLWVGKTLIFCSALGWPLLAAGQAGGVSRSEEAAQLLTLANQTRASEGAGVLQWDPALAAAALKHCQRMAVEGPIAHLYSGELTLTERAAQQGAHFALIEENVAMGPTAAVIHDSWMHSPGHRKNLLAPDVDRVGIAVVASHGSLYAVADYAHGVQSLDAAQVEAQIAAMIAARGVHAASGTAEARAACSTDRGLPQSAGGVAPGFVMRWQGTDLHQLPEALVKRLASGSYHQAAVGSCPARGTEGSFTLYRLAVLLY